MQLASKYILTALFFFIGFIVSAQQEANIWYFGEQAGLDFNSGAPVVLEDSAMSTQEGCASIANGNGELLMYTDGVTLWNRNHAIMQNGEGLGGSFSSTQSGIIVPRPGNSNEYYVFTVDFQGQPNGLQYSLVDMTLDGGLGAVTGEKNVQLITPAQEKLTATRHANGVDIWVLAHENGSDAFYAYLVTAAGVQSPIISNIGISLPGGPNFEDNAGYLKFNIQGTQVVNIYPNHNPAGIQLFDFDKATGILTNELTIVDQIAGYGSGYGVEFSPSGDLLYVGGTERLVQYDLNAGTPFQIYSSIVILGDDNAGYSYRAIQLGPDGKMYAVRVASNINDNPNIPFISVINNPDVLGVGCDFQLDAINLGTGIADAGLPQFIQSFFSVGFNYTNVCAGNAAQFNANISESYDSILWDFGDTNTSTDENPSHTYASAGTYTVTLTVTAGGQSATETQEVVIFEQPTANTPSNLTSCDTNNDGFFSFNLTQVEAQVLNGQDPTLFDFEYYASLADLNTDTPIGNPASYQNLTAFASQEVFVSIYNNQNAECLDTTSFTIQTFYSPDPANIIPPIQDCDNTSAGTDTDGQIIFDLTAQETFLYNGVPTSELTLTYFQDAGLTMPIANPAAYINTNAQETIFVQLVNPNNLTCEEVASFTLEVFELPVVQNPVVLSQCDDDTDGFSIFNLEQVATEISANSGLETITFHESEQQAIDNTSPIPNPIAYQNQVVSTDQVWARVENANGCIRISEVQLLVSTTQIPLDFTREFYQCDDNAGGTTSDGIATFNFSAVTQEIEVLFPAGQQLVITYYQTLADALSEVNAITDIVNYENTASPGTQEIYIRVDSLLDNDCLGLGEHITLFVETVPIANPVTIDTLCDTDGDSLADFDTTTIESDLLQGQTGMSVTYTDQLGNPLPSPLPNPFTTATQTITATLTNTISQDPDGPCTDQTTITFQVEAAAIANPIPEQRTCDDDGDGLFDFDTTGFEATILNGQTGMTVTYTAQDGTVLASPLPNPFTTATQEVTVRVENQLSAACFDETVITFFVDAQPEAFTVMDDFVCDDASNDDEASFVLSVYNTEVLNGQSAGDFEVSYYASAEDAQDALNPLANSHINTSNPQEIFARIENSDNANCFDISSFEIGVYQLPIAQDIEDVNICDIDNDGEENVFLSSFNNDIVNGQTNTSISYHLSQSDANTNLNAVDTNYLLEASSIQLFARLESTISSDCYTTTSFTITLREQPEIDLETIYYLCDTVPFQVSISSGYDAYLWSTGATSQTISIDTPGGYSVTVSNFYGDFVCEETFNFQVIQSGLPTITDVIVTDFTQNENSIEVLVEGSGDYEYSLLGFPWQDENIFTNLPLQAEYIIRVRDKNGCGIAFEEAYLLYAPKFFTPNGDGYHDTWNIVNFNRESNGVTHIFDRYGKLLTTLGSGSIGWDGTFNGVAMPSNGYWYRFERGNGQVYTGGFSLITRGN